VWIAKEKDMITKALLCGCVMGFLAAFAAMLDRGHARALDSLVQMPACAGAAEQCQNANAAVNGSTDRFFMMLAMH